jgi:hypothetical protein
MQTDVIPHANRWAPARGAPTCRPTNSSSVADTVVVRPDFEPVST